MPHTVTSAESSIEYVEDRDQLDCPHTRQADLQNFHLSKPYPCLMHAIIIRTLDCFKNPIR